MIDNLPVENSVISRRSQILTGILQKSSLNNYVLSVS